jgi:hypothetical protein
MQIPKENTHNVNETINIPIDRKANPKGARAFWKVLARLGLERSNCVVRKLLLIHLYWKFVLL